MAATAQGYVSFRSCLIFSLTWFSLEDLKALDEERRTLQPEADSPAPELDGLDEVDGIEELEEELDEIKMDSQTPEDDDLPDSEDEEVPTRTLRRASDRAVDRKKRMVEDRKRKDKVDAGKTKKAIQRGTPARKGPQEDRALQGRHSRLRARSSGVRQRPPRE